MRAGSEITPVGTRRRWIARLVALSLAGVAAIYGAALTIATRPAFQSALRDRIERTLRARLGTVAVGGEVHVDPLFRVTFGPVVVPGSRPTDPPVIRIERVRVRPRLGALLGGRADPASIRLYEVRVEAGPGGRELQELVARLRRRTVRRPSPAAAPRPSIEENEPEGEDPPILVRGLVVHLTAGRRDLLLGPADASVVRARDRGTERVWLELALPGGARAEAALARDAAGWSGEVRVSGLGPDALPPALQGGAIDVQEGRLGLALQGTVAPDLSRADARAHVTAEGVVLAGERVGAEAVGPLRASADGAVRWDGVERRLTLRGGTLELLGTARAAVEGEVRVGPGLPFAVTVRANDVDFSALAGALPPGLALPADAPRPAGTLDARLAVEGPLVAPDAWSVDAALDLSRMREAARRAAPVPLRLPFVHRPEVERGTPPAILVGPRSPDFVPVSELPTYVVRAVTACEDGGFYGHEGFDFEELKNAFAAGARRGRVVRGGSTISQQVAKNLYLSHDKTLARKLREAVLTVALEATLPKQRIMEIYLNVAEWGPGIWGIGPAARHWFGRDARTLTPKQAAFLATVIPNPVRYHFMWERGAPTEAWEQRVDEVLLRMSEQGSITDEDVATAVHEPLTFARPAAMALP